MFGSFYVLEPPWTTASGAAALIAISLDLLMEPVAVRLGLWRWTPPGAWLGVPVGNFVGWAVIVAWHPLVSAVPERVAFLLMLGGVLYTVGVVFHLWERLPFQNAIWHGFVLAAATVHFAAVVDIVGS